MKRNVRGFTLIELLIVITILGILSVLGARQFGNATAKANAQADQTNAQIIANAVSQAILMSGKSSSEFKTVNGNDVMYAQVNVSMALGDMVTISEYINAIPQVKAGSGERYFFVGVDSNGNVQVAAGKNPEENVKLYPVDNSVLAASEDYKVLVQ